MKVKFTDKCLNFYMQMNEYDFVYNEQLLYNINSLADLVKVYFRQIYRNIN